jgi:hypothetical protein
MNCVYCPIKGKNNPQAYMSSETIDNIINKFSNQKDIKRIELGENGEFLLHPNALDNIRKLRDAFNNNIIFSVFTNFSLLDKNIAEILVTENLIDEITTTRHSINDNNKNLMQFIKLRDKNKANIKITLSIFTDYRYASMIFYHFGCMPAKLKDISLMSLDERDEERLIKYWKTKLNINKDRMIIPIIFSWAERQNPKIPDKYKINTICPLIKNNTIPTSLNLPCFNLLMILLRLIMSSFTEQLLIFPIEIL